MSEHTHDPKHALEEGTEVSIDFTKLTQIGQSDAKVVPVAVQDADSKEVLIIAYANAEALQHTLEHGIATFWSTSRNELWVKGATSGDTLEMIEVRVNCEQNSLLYIVRPQGKGVCHTKNALGQRASYLLLSPHVRWKTGIRGGPCLNRERLESADFTGTANGPCPSRRVHIADIRTPKIRKKLSP